MAKLFNYVVVFTGISLLLALAGFATPTNELLSVMGVNITSSAGVVQGINVDNVGNTSFVGFLFRLFSSLLTISGISAGAAIVIGYLVSKTPIEGVKAGFATFITSWLTLDMVSIITLAFASYADWVGWILTLVIIPLLAGLWMAVMNFATGGGDT